MRILIVEDDEFTATALATVLEHQNYAVEFAEDGQVAWDLVQAFDYDLIILDVMLPKLDGIGLCRVVRKHDLKMPILLLTGKDSSHDKAIGLDAGADDYLVKPFDAEELVARVRALLRRGNSTSLPVLEWGSLRLDPTSCEVTYSTQLVKVTPKEYALLELFLRNPRRMFSCSAILDRIWSFDNTPGEEAVRTQIKGLRHKLRAAGAAPDLIETVYGIGYRMKPHSKDVASESSKEEPKQQTLAALAGVWDRFKERINQQVSVLEQAVQAVLQNTLSRDAITLVSTQASLEAHTLAGSLGTFGLSKGSRLAQKIENYLQMASFDSKQAKHLRKLVQQLRKEIEQPPQSLVSASLTNSYESPKLLIIDSDRQLGSELVTQAEIQGVTAEVATSLSEAYEKIRHAPPNVVLLDPAVGNTTEEGWALLAQLQQTPSIPVLIFTAGDSLGSRLEVARLGARTFLQKPLPAIQVMEAVTQVLQPSDTDAEAVVMVVDDDRQVLAALRTLLEPWGLKVITLEDPRQFWETLEASTPDILVLDIKMPYVSGIELCQVVRNDVNWGGLPILFLTVYTDVTTVHQVFGVGADDFVSKPIIGPEVVTRILNRLERVKLLRSLAETDPLTTVYNRNRATQDLNKFLRLSVRHNQPLCLAILDLDNFKYVNDTFGHATGDAVLRRFGQLLRRSFRSEDVVSRWGGEEFVVGMYAMSRSEGVQRLNKVRETLHQQEFIAVNKSKFRVTFSAGVAQSPENGTDLQSLYMSADAALYQAKAAGRDRVLAAI